MFIRSFDLITPKITLYFNGRKTHSSIFSGALTIIAYTLILTMSIYFSLDLIKRQNPSVFYLNRFIDDAGIFPMNSSSMFHFFQFTLVDNSIGIVDFDSITIVGMEQLIGTYTSDNNLTKYNHWLYGNCDMKDAKGLEKLINYPNFNQSGCIKKYYNAIEQKYYNINEKGFVWPTLIHGCSHPNRTFYGIIIERCRNSTLREKYCKTPEQIDNFININPGLSFRLIDHYSQVNDYNEPFKKYFYTLTNGLFNNEFATNHLNLNPSRVITHNGFFFDNINTINSYTFEQNEKITDKTNGTGIYCAFYFWMQNRLQLYERSYKRIQDILASVGGITKTISLFAQIINFLYYKYIILIDTAKMLNQMINNDTIKHESSILNKSQINLNNYFPNSNYDLKNRIQQTFTHSLNMKKKKFEINFWIYLLHFINSKKKKKKINFYEKFRIKLISEEHIIHNHLNVYQFMKMCEKHKIQQYKVKYELSDIINYI